MLPFHLLFSRYIIPPTATDHYRHINVKSFQKAKRSIFAKWSQIAIDWFVGSIYIYVFVYALICGHFGIANKKNTFAAPF